LITINFAGASLSRPGSYSRIRVADSSAADAQLGVVALIGEADEGDAWAAETQGLAGVTYLPTQFAAIQDKFGTGQLVDAAKLALAPSNDDQILGGAQQLIMMKTNQSVKASLTLASTYGTIKAKRAGAPGNNTSITIAIAASQATITIARNDLGLTETSTALGNKSVITVQCTDGVSSAATLTINATHFTTTITGGTASSLNIPLSQFQTIGDLVAFLNTQSGYTASVASVDQTQQPLSVLDRVSAVNILVPYSVKRDAADIQNFFAGSQLVDFTPGASGYVGLPAALTKTYLSGGARGATTQAQFQTALDALNAASCNFVVALFSRDAASNVTDGLSETGSTYAIDSVHAAIRTHCVQNSTIKGRKERQGFCAIMNDTYTTVKEKSAALGSSRVSLHFQRIDALDSTGSLVTMQPHMLAVINASMKAAAPVGLPNTYKLVNISGFKTLGTANAAFFDPETDAEDAIAANLTFVEKAPGGGFRFVLDNSTYGQTKDAWVFNRPSVLYAADVAAKTIRLNTEAFVGRRNSDVTNVDIENFLVTVMDSLRAQGIIVPDKKSKGKGFKDLSVEIAGSVVKPCVTLVLVEGYEFILNDITVTRASF
jgi:hypothetical protein